jgi:hypothetical protein
MSTAMRFTKSPDERTMVTLYHGDSLSKIKAFAYQIQPYTHAAITRATATVGSQMTIAAKSGDFQSIRHYGQMFFKRRRDGKLYSLKLPAPDRDMFQDGTEDDLIVKPSIGVILAGFYSTLAGEIFDFHSGAFCGANV